MVVGVLRVIKRGLSFCLGCMRGIWMDNSQIERIGINKVESFFTEELDWIFREQSILDYGIDMQVEIKENGKATGLLIALQIKSGDTHCRENESKNIFTYIGSLRHLEYWKNHSLPVVFIWYRQSNKSLYWQSVSLESKHININDKSWTLQIPTNQILNPNSKEDLLSKCFNFNNYQVIEESNISTNQAIRYRLKVILPEKGKYLIKKVIQRIYNKYIKLYGDINSLSIFYYRSVNDSMHFCRTQWNNENYDYKLYFVKKNDEIGDIEIEWEEDSDHWNKHFSDNSELISKYDYIKILDKSIDLCSKFIEETVNKNIDELKVIILNFNQDIQDEFHLVTDDNYQFSKDTTQLKLSRMSAIHWLHDISIIFQDNSRDSQNKYLCFKGYIEDLKNDVLTYNTYKKVSRCATML
jgi:hypothetical protein